MRVVLFHRLHPDESSVLGSALHARALLHGERCWRCWDRAIAVHTAACAIAVHTAACAIAVHTAACAIAVHSADKPSTSTRYSCDTASYSGVSDRGDAADMRQGPLVLRCPVPVFAVLCHRQEYRRRGLLGRLLYFQPLLQCLWQHARHRSTASAARIDRRTESEPPTPYSYGHVTPGHVR